MSDIDRTKELLLKILHRGILRIRMLANEGRADACYNEADHIHNIPGILSTFRWDQVEYYCKFSQPGFIKRAKSNIDDFRQLWEALDGLVARALPGEGAAG